MAWLLQINVCGGQYLLYRTCTQIEDHTGGIWGDKFSFDRAPIFIYPIAENDPKMAHECLRQHPRTK